MHTSGATDSKVVKLRLRYFQIYVIMDKFHDDFLFWKMHTRLYA